MVDTLAHAALGFGDLSPGQTATGNVVFLLALFLTAFLERLQLQLRATETSTWWASNGRDVANTVALGSMVYGLGRLGFEGPIAFTVAATGVILLTWVQSASAQSPHAFELTLASALLWGLPVLLMPQWVDSLFRGLLSGLFAGTLTKGQG
jgi:hypothetical protein